MARALKNPAAAPTYLEFFGMNRAPFARVSEPVELFHAEQYTLLYAHLSSATGRAGHLLVLSGADGSGKTTLLNRFIASLDHETSYATFDENCADPNAFYCGLLRQLGFSDISGGLNELRHIAREFLLHRGRAGDPVLVIIDNAQLVSPSVLEQLRWLADISVQGKNVVSLVLSGNAELARIMASPAMSLLNLATRVDFSIRALSEQETDDYVRHRLRLAGGSESAKLVAKARPLIHRFSGGNPRRINRFCNALLTEALSQETRILDEALARKVADEQEFIPHVLPVSGQGRRKTDRQDVPASPELTIEERISQRESPPQQAAADFAAGREPEKADVEKLLSEVERLSDELDVSRTRANRVLRDVDARDSDIKALIGKIEQQAKDLERAERKAQESDEEAQNLKDKLQQSEELGKELRDELKAQKRSATDSHKESRKLGDKLQQSEQLTKKLRDELNELERSAKNSHEKAEELQDKLQRSEQLTDELRDELNAQKGSAKKAEDSHEESQQLKDRLQQSEQSTKELRDELNAQKSTAKKAQSELSKAERRLQRLDTRKTELQESVRSLKSEQKKTAAQAKRAQKAQDKRIAQLEQCVAELEKERESLQSKADEADRLEHEMAGKEAYLRELQGELDEYIEEVTATRVQLADDMAGPQSEDATPDPDAYVGTISAIEVFHNGQPQHVVPLHPGLKRLMVGRGDDSEICLKSKFVSRHHALIFLSGKQAYIEDLRSYNGTVVNSRKISRCDLNPDDTISIGDFDLRPRRGQQVS